MCIYTYTTYTYVCSDIHRYVCVCLPASSFQTQHHLQSLVAAWREREPCKFLQNTTMDYLIVPAGCVYITSTYILIYLFHLQSTHNVSIHYSYVILLHTHRLPIACLFATYFPIIAIHSAPAYFRILPLSYLSMTNKLHQPPHPPHAHSTGGGGNHIHYLDISY